MTIDYERLDRALAWAEAHSGPSLADEVGNYHNQYVWIAPGRLLTGPGAACGTACCLAGWVVLDAGYRPQYPNRESSWVIAKGGEDEAGLLNSDDGTLPVDALAARLLGLNFEQWRALFDSNNTLPVLRRLREVLGDDPDRVDLDLAVLFQSAEEAVDA